MADRRTIAALLFLAGPLLSGCGQGSPGKDQARENAPAPLSSGQTLQPGSGQAPAVSSHTPNPSSPLQERKREREINPDQAARLEELHHKTLQLLTSQDPEERADAVAALRSTDADEREKADRILLEDPEPEVRQAAAETLSFGQNPESIPTLIKALSDSEPDVVLAAIDALGWYEDDARVIQALQNLAKHPDATVRTEAQNALESLTPPE